MIDIQTVACFNTHSPILHLFLPVQCQIHNNTCWFADSPVGINKLQKVVKIICERGGLPGFYTNHSLRATAATRLYHENFDEQLIQEVTGHQSVAVRAYKRTRSGQHKSASLCLKLINLIVMRP